MNTRAAAFAGSWYPRQADACEKEIRGYLSRDIHQLSPSEKWTAGIVPHAGWIFSGHLACQVIDLLKSAEPIDTVVIFGMHLHSGSPNHMMAQGAWETPFGDLAVDEDLAEYLMTRFEFRLETPHRFVQDNTIEVQLPFVKHLLNPQRILAIGVPPTSQAVEIGKAAGQWVAAHQRRVRVIGSTDLTHYGPNYGFSPQGSGRQAVEWVRDQNDRRIIDAMVAMDTEQILREGATRQNACCAGAVAAAVAAARQLGAREAHEVAYASSYDLSPGDSFVGYTGVVFRG